MTDSTITTSGPDFISFQVRDIARAADFYEKLVGLRRLPAPNPHAEVFSDGSITFAVRTPLPGLDLDAVAELGAGIAVWFHSPETLALHERLVNHGIEIIQAPFDGPFGTTFSFRDPDGYVLTVHSKG